MLGALIGSAATHVSPSEVCKECHRSAGSKSRTSDFVSPQPFHGRLDVWAAASMSHGQNSYVVRDLCRGDMGPLLNGC